MNFATQSFHFFQATCDIGATHDTYNAGEIMFESWVVNPANAQCEESVHQRDSGLCSACPVMKLLIVVAVHERFSPGRFHRSTLALSNTRTKSFLWTRYGVH